VSTIAAVEMTVTAPVASFRNPLYAGVQVGLPCPPPATVGGMLAAAAGGWDAVSPRMRFAMAFHAGGRGEDLETYHPLDAGGRRTEPTPRLRQFLADVTLTVWLVEDAESWQRRLRRPVWPMRLGRSQDLVGARVRRVLLDQTATAAQRGSIIPADRTRTGVLLRLPTAVARDRSRTRWDDYRYDPTGRTDAVVADAWSDEDGRAVVLLPATHPVYAESDGAA
jgi:CRISPR-associated Cas5-like protein